MKQLVSYVLIISYLVGSTGFGQLLKLPTLIDHYSQHRSSCGELDFSSFLYMHYVVDDQDPTDDDKDKQLPFKSQANVLGAESLPASDIPDPLFRAMEESDKPLDNHDNKPLSAHRAVILQPPKIA